VLINPATETYSYDPLYRLTQIREADGSTLESVTYNQTGDRLSKTGSGLGTGNYSYNPNTHQLMATGNAARSVDANGNTTAVSQAGSTYGFGYNDRNRMAVAQLAGNTVGSYTYNALSQRVQKVANGTTHRFDEDEDSQMLAEYGAINRDYIWMDGVPVANVDMSGSTSTIAYVTADQLGTPRAVADGSSNTIWQWPYQGNAWGEFLPTSNGYIYNQRFTGQYFDAETGLHYNVNRDFDSSTGRYIESDPNGLFGDQLSTYSYVDGAPLVNIDPLGLASGRWEQIPGTNTWVRIDGPHVDGQQTHAHVDSKGFPEVAINKDGTASHGSDLSKMTRNKKVLQFLAKKGFAIECLSTVGDAFFIRDLVKNVEAQACSRGDANACAVYQSMSGQPVGPPEI
jgi:RHS repeat-associated protein